MRFLRSEMLIVRAQPRLKDVVREVRQLRVDYNTENEGNSVLKSNTAHLEAQLGAQEEALLLHGTRIDHAEDSYLAGGVIKVHPPPPAILKPAVGTVDVNRHEEEHLRAKTPEPRSRHLASRSRKSRKRRDPSLSSSWSSDTEDSSSDSDSSSDDVRKRRKSKRHGPTGRTKGKKYGELKELKPTNSLYKELSSYRYYRLNNNSQKRTKKQSGRVSSQIKLMELSLSEHKFDGFDPIKVLDFLSRFVNEANVLDMGEGQAYLALPNFLRAREQFEAHFKPPKI